MKEKYIRIYYKTYREIRHYFPAMRGESVAEYFERFIDYVIAQGEAYNQYPNPKK